MVALAEASCSGGLSRAASEPRSSSTAALAAAETDSQCESPQQENQETSKTPESQQSGDDRVRLPLAYLLKDRNVKKKLLSSHKKYRSHSQPLLEPFGSEKR